MKGRETWRLFLAEIMFNFCFYFYKMGMTISTQPVKMALK